VARAAELRGQDPYVEAEAAGQLRDAAEHDVVRTQLARERADLRVPDELRERHGLRGLAAEHGELARGLETASQPIREPLVEAAGRAPTVHAKRQHRDPRQALDRRGRRGRFGLGRRRSAHTEGRDGEEAGQQPRQENPP
jgi:hypothetical protein